MEEKLIHKEIETKINSVQSFMRQHKVGGICLSRRDNFAWVTAGGDNHVVNSTEDGFSSILITQDNKYFLSDNVECQRMLDEQLSGFKWEIITFEWHKGEEVYNQIRKIVGNGKKIQGDSQQYGCEPLLKEFGLLRYTLQPSEIDRYKVFAKEAAACLEETCKEIQPGMSEFEISALLSKKEVAAGFEPAARLVGADERIFNYRHPIPSDKKLKNHALVVLLGQKKGLYINLSRVVYFGSPPSELRKIHHSACQVDAVYLLNSRPGNFYRDIFNQGIKEYASLGYEGEWKKFTQGGVIGYKAREFVATPDTSHKVSSNQAVAWNPTVTGSKCEDTVLITDSGLEVLSAISSWPMIEISYQGQTINRPDILVR